MSVPESDPLSVDDEFCGVATPNARRSAIPLLVPSMPDLARVADYMKLVYQNRWYTNFGPLVRDLEGRLSLGFLREPGPVHVVTLASGTAALELGLVALKLKRSARVLVPSLTFVATATAVLRAGFKPLIGDVDPGSWLLTPDIARRLLKKVRFDAVVAVATFGCPQNVFEWDRFTAETGVKVLIDAAGAYGNQDVGITTGVAFSLHATKSLGAGEGGFIASRQYAFVEEVRRLSNFGLDFKSGGLVFEPGTNAKLSEFHAAVGLAALDVWGETSSSRIALYQYYQGQIEQRIPQLGLQQKPASGVYPIYCVALPSGSSVIDVQSWLSEHKIETRRWYCPPLHVHPAFTRYVLPDIDVVASLASRVLGLPFFIGLSFGEVDYILDMLAEGLAKFQ